MAEKTRLTKVSDVGLVLSIVEVLMYPFALILAIIATIKIVRTALLPGIIRALLCLTLLRVPLTIVRRSYILSMRVFMYGEAALPLQEINTRFHFFAFFIISICGVAFSLQLLLSSYTPKFTNKLKKLRITLTVAGLIIIICVTFGLFKIAHSIIYVEIAALTISIMVLAIIFISNQKWRKTRVQDAKSTWEENMRSIRIIAPLLIHENIFHLANLAAIQVQIWLSPNRRATLNYDPSIFNNVFGLLIACEVLITPTLLLFCLNRMTERQKTLQTLFERRNADDDGQRYFQQLHSSWN